MSIYEYDEEKTMRMFREEWYEDGNQNGIQTGLQVAIMIKSCLDHNLSSDDIIQNLMTNFHFSSSQAQEYLNQYIAQNA